MESVLRRNKNGICGKKYCEMSLHEKKQQKEAYREYYEENRKEEKSYLTKKRSLEAIYKE